MPASSTQPAAADLLARIKRNWAALDPDGTPAGRSAAERGASPVAQSVTMAENNLRRALHRDICMACEWPAESKPVSDLIVLLGSPIYTHMGDTKGAIHPALVLRSLAPTGPLAFVSKLARAVPPPRRPRQHHDPHAHKLARRLGHHAPGATVEQG